MPWRECSVMEERLRFVARLLDGEGMSGGVPGVRDLAQDRLQDLQSLQGGGARGALTDRSRRPVRYANQLPDPIERLIVRPSGTSRIGAPARSGSCWSAGSPATCASRPRARSMRCSIAMAWSSGRQRRRHKAEGTPLSPGRRCPTICGAPTSRASSSSATAATVTP